VCGAGQGRVLIGSISGLPERILPTARIVDLPVEHPMFSILYQIKVLPQIPSLGSWRRFHEDSEIGPSTVHYYGVFGDDDRDYFETYSARGYALGVNVAVWAMTH